MALSFNKPKPDNLAGDIWKSAERLRGKFKSCEYIPHGEDIEAFLKREIAEPIIRWADSPQLGYEIPPSKYFYRYQPPTPATDLLAEFWRLEKEAEKMLEGLAR